MDLVLENASSHSVSDFVYVFFKGEQLFFSLFCLFVCFCGRTSTTANTPSYRRQNNRHIDCGPLNERRRRTEGDSIESAKVDETERDNMGAEGDGGHRKTTVQWDWEGIKWVHGN